MRVPSTSTTWTRAPAGTNDPSLTTSTYWSPNWTDPAGRSTVIVRPTAPSSPAASATPGIASTVRWTCSPGGSSINRLA